MAIAVIATVGAVNANSFQTVAEIDLYFQGRVPESVRTSWLDADSNDKDAAAVMATTYMTAMIDWSGYPTTLTQALPWPRNSMLARNHYQYILSNVIPQEVKNAHAELARLLLLTDRTAELDQQIEGLAQVKVGPINIGFRNPSGKGSSRIPFQIIPDFIIELLVPSWVEDYSGGAESNRELLRY